MIAVFNSRTFSRSMFPDVMILERASLKQPLLQDNQYDGLQSPLVLTLGNGAVKPYRNSLEASCQMIDH